MEINQEKVKLSAVRLAIRPTLQVRAEVEYERGSEVLVGISGRVLSQEGIVLGYVQEIAHGVDRARESPLEARLWIERQQSMTVDTVILEGHLPFEAIDHLHARRESDPKKAVHIVIEFHVRSYETRILHSRVRVGATTEKNLAPVFFVVESDPRKPDIEDGWILSGTKQKLGIQRTRGVLARIAINATDWLQDFFGPWKGQTFLLFELVQPAAETEGNSDLHKRIDRAKKALFDARAKLDRGEWSDVVQELRDVPELLRDESVISDLLVRSGYTAEAVKSMVDSLRAQFDLASKFLHPLDRGKRLQAEMTAQKEDAQLVFTVCAATVNLVTRKLGRVGT